MFVIMFINSSLTTKGKRTMGIFIFMLFAVAYIVTSKMFLLDKARHDVQNEYRVGNTVMRFYILSMLPILYIKGL